MDWHRGPLLDFIFLILWRDVPAELSRFLQEILRERLDRRVKNLLHFQDNLLLLCYQSRVDEEVTRRTRFSSVESADSCDRDINEPLELLRLPSCSTEES